MRPLNWSHPWSRPIQYPSPMPGFMLLGDCSWKAISSWIQPQVVWYHYFCLVGAQNQIKTHHEITKSIAIPPFFPPHFPRNSPKRVFPCPVMVRTRRSPRASRTAAAGRPRWSRWSPRLRRISPRQRDGVNVNPGLINDGLLIRGGIPPIVMIQPSQLNDTFPIKQFGLY